MIITVVGTRFIASMRDLSREILLVCLCVGNICDKSQADAINLVPTTYQEILQMKVVNGRRGGEPR